MLEENDIVELDEKIFQFGPVSEPQRNVDLRIFVHPLDRYGCYEGKSQNYASRRDELIRNEEIPNILLVGGDDLPSVLGRYKKPLFSSYKSIFLTREYSPEPLNGSWKGLKDFIRKKINPKKLLISGAVLTLIYNEKCAQPEMSGCVGYTYSHLKEFNPEVQIENCFVHKWKV